MSKRLFILSSLLETHPRRTSTQTRVWTAVVIKAEIRPERRRAPSRAAIRHAIRPFAQQGLDQAFGLAIGLRTVRSRKSLAHQPALRNGGDGGRPIRPRVVGEQPTDANPPSTKPGERALKKRGAGGGVAGRKDLGIREPARIIDGDVEVLPANAARAPAPVAMNAMAHAGHATQTFEIDVEQIADLGPLIALDRSRGLEERDAIESDPRQDARDGRPRHPQRGADLPRRRTRPPQRHDRCLQPWGRPSRLAIDLSADPPLPQAEILALLFSDVPPGQDVELRQYSTALTPQQQLLRERAARLVTGTVSSEVGKAVEQTFGLDTVQITPTLVDPNVQSSRLDPGARLTIGKRLSDRAYLTYARSLSSSTRDEIVMLEYDQTDRFSWILSRNEDRTYALEVRVRHVF